MPLSQNTEEKGLGKGLETVCGDENELNEAGYKRVFTPFVYYDSIKVRSKEKTNI